MSEGVEKLPFSIKKALREIDVSFAGQQIRFRLELSVQDLNDIKRLSFGYFHSVQDELEHLASVTKKGTKGEKQAYLSEFLATSFSVRDQGISKIKELLMSGKIRMLGSVKDADGVQVTEADLCSMIVFYELLANMLGAIASWDASAKDIKKKQSGLLWFDQIFKRTKHKSQSPTTQTPT